MSTTIAERAIERAIAEATATITAEPIGPVHFAITRAPGRYAVRVWCLECGQEEDAESVYTEDMDELADNCQDIANAHFDAYPACDTKEITE